MKRWRKIGLRTRIYVILIVLVLIFMAGGMVPLKVPYLLMDDCCRDSF